MTRVLSKASLSLALLFAVGCVSTQQTTESTPIEVTKAKPRVETMKLSKSWGEVGRTFESDLTVFTKDMDEREYSIHNLPPGLRFDSESQKIVGVPKNHGFFVVNVAVRPKRERTTWEFVAASDKWWIEDFELRIYNPIDG